MRSTSRDSSGRIQRGNLVRVGRERTASGGFQTVEGGRFASSREGVEAEQREQAQAEYERATATREESVAVASTVGPDGRPSVIRQTQTFGPASSIGGRDELLIGSSTFQNRVAIAGASPVRNIAPGRVVQPLNQESFSGQQERTERFAGTPTQRIGRAFGAGFGAGSPIAQVFGTETRGPGFMGTPTLRTQSGREAIAFEVARVGRTTGETALIVAGTGPAIRGLGFATGAARASRIGSLPLARNVLGPGVFGAVSRGVIGAGAVSATGRTVERARISRVGRETGISNINDAADVAFQRYSEGSSVGRRFLETNFGSFINQPRFQQELRTELTNRGVSQSQAGFAAERISGIRVTGRARTDFAVGIIGEGVGETTGRLATARTTRFLANRFATRSERARTIVARGGGAAFGGTFEGGIQAGAGSFQESGRVNPRDVAVGAGFGGVFAGSAGATLGFLRTSTSRFARPTANIIEGGLDIVDPLERPGDIATDTFFSGYSSRFRTRTPSFVSGDSAPSPSRSSGSRSSRANVPSVIDVSPVPRPSRTTTITPNIIPRNAIAPTPSRVPSRSSPNVFNTNLAIPNRSNALITVPTRNIVPANVPTRISVPTRTNVPTRVNTRVPTPNIPVIPFIPPFGGGAGRGRGGRSRSSNRAFSYASSLTAGVLGIRRGRRDDRSTGFTGLELRGL